VWVSLSDIHPLVSRPCPSSSSASSQVMAFVAPKIIGGERAPSPVGELGFVEMTQAVQLEDVRWRQVGPDLMVVGFLPTSNGPMALEASLSVGSGAAGAGSGSEAAAAAMAPASSTAAEEQQQAQASSTPASSLPSPSSPAAAAAAAEPSSQPSASSSSAATSSLSSTARPPSIATRARGSIPPVRKVATFYKAWDQWGSLGNFSPHPISLPLYGAAAGQGAEEREWASVEHYYQACKFSQVTEEGRAITEQARRVMG
jgi:diaminohydroxyphosphoribosylaminopyrimidine deaminase/5-amino-6-(5-phosphoribosylamino)uracil reductase